MVEPTHLKNMRKSNWIPFPQQIGVKIKNMNETTTWKWLFTISYWNKLNSHPVIKYIAKVVWRPRCSSTTTQFTIIPLYLGRISSPTNPLNNQMCQVIFFKSKWPLHIPGYSWHVIQVSILRAHCWRSMASMGHQWSAVQKALEEWCPTWAQRLATKIGSMYIPVN